MSVVPADVVVVVVAIALFHKNCQDKKKHSQTEYKSNQKKKF